MGALSALKQILLGAVPTFILVWILYVYISRVFYRPLQRTLAKRREETTGLRKSAEAEMARAEQKAAQYEDAIRSARAEVYQIQEKERQAALERRAEIVHEAQQRAEQTVARAREEIKADAENAKARLASEAGEIAVSIMNSILKPLEAAEVGRGESGGGR